MITPATFLIDDADVPALRGLIAKTASLGFSEKIVRERLGLDDLTELQWRALPAYRKERLAGRELLDLAIELFLLQRTLPTNELERLFTRSELEMLVRAGLLAVNENGGATARASLFPVGDRLIFSDHAWPELSNSGRSPVPYDQVMFVGPDSRHLARCTSRRPVRSALDLCTGSGVQAALAAAHAEQVLAVDLNPRAAACARFNVQALGIENLRVAEGDLFEPAAGERFDLITANPPFVPSPVDALRFRDGGRSGEDIQKRIVAGLPQHLAPGGMAQMVTELGEREGESIVERLREWLAGAPFDIHVLRLRDHTPIRYAIAHAKGEEYDTFLGSVDDWASNLRTQGFVRIVALLISFQWSNPACGGPWDRMEESPPPKRDAGSEIEAAFLAERSTRLPDLEERLRRGFLRLAGPLALFDARVTGREIPPHAKATRLGQALTIEQQLDPVERELIGRIEPGIAVSELLTTLCRTERDEQGALAGIISLMRRRLVRHSTDPAAGR